MVVILFLAACVFSNAAFAGTKMPETFAYYYYREGRIDEAIAEYKKILKEDPGNYKIHYNLGVLYAQSKKYSLAIAAFRKAANVKSPLRKDALYNLVIIYGKYLKDTNKAYKYYEEFKEINCKE